MGRGGRRHSGRGQGVVILPHCRAVQSTFEIRVRLVLGVHAISKDPERTADAYHGPWFTLGDIDTEIKPMLHHRSRECIISAVIDPLAGSGKLPD